MAASARMRMIGLGFAMSLFCLAASPAQNLQTAPQLPATSPAPPQASADTAASAAPAPTQSGSARQLRYELNHSISKGWVDTGIDLVAGDTVTVEASGKLQSLAGGAFGPEGLARTWADLLQSLPVKDAGRGALIARLGGNSYDTPFLVGSRKEFVAARAARLFLGVNDASGGNLQGDVHVVLTIVPASPRAETTRDANFPAELLQQVPRRITDAQGRAGDMVNFILVGDEQAVLRAFADAGWVQVDRSKTLGILHAALGTLDKKSYTEMPMSELYAYGRPQDYGFAHAEPVRVVMTRHHLRVWKAPFDFNTAMVWIGAATHDIGFEKDQRTGGVTHKIDPKVDDERTFVEQTLFDSGDVAASNYVVPPDPVRDARTATGGTFTSDGRILVLVLR